MNIPNNLSRFKALIWLLIASAVFVLLYFHLVRTKPSQQHTEVAIATSSGIENAVTTNDSVSSKEFTELSQGTASLSIAPSQTQPAKNEKTSGSFSNQSFENDFISGNSLNSKNIYSTIESDKKFIDAMSRLKSEAVQDSETLELTRKYNEAINSLDSDDKNIKLNEFVCGENICIGSLHETASVSNWDGWLVNFEENKNAPHYATIHTTIDLGNGQFEHRIVTSINKNIPGIVTK